MSKYNSGDKFVIEVETAFGLMGGDPLYTIKGFNALVFDDYGLDKLQKYDEVKERLELIDELKQAEYNRGLKDAWELVEKIFEMPIDEREMALSIDEHYLEDILVRLTPQEALKRLEAYEESKAIKVGDVVTCFNDYKGVVLDRISEQIDVFTENGCVECLVTNDVKKTNKHLDIEHLLEQIRGE